MVNGMSCDHCAHAVRAEIDVDVAAGRVRITGLRDAVEEAGYEFAG